MTESVPVAVPAPDATFPSATHRRASIHWARLLAGESWDVSRVILSCEEVDNRGDPSEAFFEEPAAFARELPALYRALADVYRLDPAAWIRNGG